MKQILLALVALLLTVASCQQVNPNKPGGVILLEFNGYQADTALYGYYNYMQSMLDTSERQATVERVQELFKDFDVMVTTDRSTFYTYPTNKRAQVIVTWNYLYGLGGISKLGTVATGDTIPSIVAVPGFIDPSTNKVAPRYLGECIAHEIGHQLGLQHQALWISGKKTVEYNEGNPSYAPIMGVSYNSKEAVWWKGLNTSGIYQDDAAILAQTWPRKPIQWTP